MRFQKGFKNWKIAINCGSLFIDIFGEHEQYEKTAEDFMEEVLNVINKKYLESSLEKKFLILRYGFNDEKNIYHYKEILQMLNINRSTQIIIKNNLLEYLRNNL